jgi:hypothetical protein
LGWILRVILVILIVRALWRLMRGVVRGLDGRPSGRADRAVPLVRDPVCGVYVVRSRALTVGQGESALYFCSERCRSQYRPQ